MTSFKGIFAPLTTPFENDRISSNRLKENIEKLNPSELAGYVVLGSTGESVYLSDHESEILVKTAREYTNTDKKVIVGTDRESTALTLEFTNRMAELEIDAALIRTPRYFKANLDEEALISHYLSIADAAKIPIILYNIPVHTGITLSPKVIIELSKHTNILGIKDSSGNLSVLGEVTPHLDLGFNFLLGAASVLLPGLLFGADGAIITLSTVVPELCTQLYDLFLKKEWESALKLQKDLIPLNKALTQIYGIPATKYALELRGLYGGPPRSPLRPLEDDACKILRSLMEKLGLTLI